MTEQEIIKTVKATAIPARFTKYYVYSMDGIYITSTPIEQKAIATAIKEKAKYPHYDFIVIEMPPTKKP